MSEPNPLARQKRDTAIEAVVFNGEILHIHLRVLYAIEKGLEINAFMMQEMKAAQYVLVTMDARKDQQVREITGVSEDRCKSDHFVIGPFASSCFLDRFLQEKFQKTDAALSQRCTFLKN
jgi:hypothetical protein